MVNKIFFSRFPISKESGMKASGKLFKKCRELRLLMENTLSSSHFSSVLLGGIVNANYEFRYIAAVIAKYPMMMAFSNRFFQIIRKRETLFLFSQKNVPIFQL